MSFHATITIVNGARYTGRQVLEANKVALDAAGKHWWRTMLPRHFTVEGGRKYGYQKRSGEDEPSMVYARPNPKNPNQRRRLVKNRKYYWRKWWEKRSHLPLVWSGATARSARRSVVVKFRTDRATHRLTCRVVMQVPNYFYRYRKDLKQPDKANEMTRTTPEEQSTLHRIVNFKIQNHLRNLPPRRQRIRVA